MKEAIIELRNKVDRKKSIDNMLGELRLQRSTLIEELSELEIRMEREIDDVERLERISFASVLLRIIGRMDEELSLEKREAERARLKCNMCHNALEGVKKEIAILEEERKSLGDCEERYERALKEKEAILRASDNEHALELFFLEEKLAQHRYLIRELEEAIGVGEEAFDLSKDLIDQIDAALITSNHRDRIVSNKYRHIHIDYAKAQIDELKIKLLRFKAELVDVNVRCDVKIDIDSALLIFDRLFSGLFTDLTVHSILKQARIDTVELRGCIGKAVSKARCKLDDTTRAIKHIEKKAKELVYSADI